MGTNRTRIARPLRAPRFTDEILALFVELEHAPPNSDTFEAKSKRLAQLLGLGEEHFLSGCHVNDKTKESPHPPGYIAREEWNKVRAVRLCLLDAVKARQPTTLTDSELQAVFTAAGPIDVHQGEAFVAHVAQSLEGRVVHGPGDIHRAIAAAQKKYMHYPSLEKMNGQVRHSGLSKLRQG